MGEQIEFVSLVVLENEFDSGILEELEWSCEINTLFISGNEVVLEVEFESDLV